MQRLAEEVVEFLKDQRISHGRLKGYPEFLVLGPSRGLEEGQPYFSIKVEGGSPYVRTPFRKKLTLLETGLLNLVSSHAERLGFIPRLSITHWSGHSMITLKR